MKSPKVDEFMASAQAWKKEFGKLRKLLLDSGLDEELKWGVPCYSLEGKNVVLIHGFKEYCAILFVKDSLLDDPEGILVAQTERVQAGCQVRFTDATQIDRLAPILKDYLRRAMDAERAGLKVQFKKTAEFDMPRELRQALDADPALKEAFADLTPGRQRAHILHVSGAKQASTRLSRVEKCAPLVKEGLGPDGR